jgi:uncharacterized protein YggE
MKPVKQVLAAFLLLAALAGAAVAQGKITVKGDAEIKVVPDQVIVALSVETNDMDIDKARSDNDSKVLAVLDMLRKQGVGEKDMQTDYINVEPRYWYDQKNNNEKKFTGYYVTKNITVILKDISKTDNVISSALKLGTNYVQSVDFQTTQLRKYQDEARLQAIRAAKEKAIVLAGELGQKIHKPVMISEDMQSQTTARGNRNMANNYSKSALMADSYSADGSTVAPGQINVKSQVTVTFELE